jgi:putative transcriptional regulator
MHQDENHTIGVMLNRPLQPTPEALLAMFGVSPRAQNRLQPDDFQDGDLQAEGHAAADASADPPEAGTNSGDRSDPASPTTKVSPWRMIHFGGPLSGPVVAIHQESQFAEAETGSGIYVAAQKQHLENLVRQEQAPYRLIVGHLGWKTEQLENEIEAGYWHVLPATVESVFSPASDMWSSLIRRATSRSLAKWIGVPDNLHASELN